MGVNFSKFSVCIFDDDVGGHSGDQKPPGVPATNRTFMNTIEMTRQGTLGYEFVCMGCQHFQGAEFVSTSITVDNRRGHNGKRSVDRFAINLSSQRQKPESSHSQYIQATLIGPRFIIKYRQLIAPTIPYSIHSSKRKTSCYASNNNNTPKKTPQTLFQ
jgi:hypothetical protein